ncbi:hypothetical protein Vadar_032773 [Vaccinium darrowii]|uniref:Uncharacterized protein n=1 Tax=Vaccinium darrowii TaxID=229202 RepID=A0ACB7ZNW3_9ERIC|nr:hypothetical protein Vadar_032773 [Vaccinium darrowii]
MEIVDRLLLLEEEDNKVDVKNEEVENEERAIPGDKDSESSSSTTGIVMDCIVSVLKIGLLCSAPLPRTRMPMNIVVNKIYLLYFAVHNRCRIKKIKEEKKDSQSDSLVSGAENVNSEH